MLDFCLKIIDINKTTSCWHHAPLAYFSCLFGHQLIWGLNHYSFCIPAAVAPPPTSRYSWWWVFLPCCYHKLFTLRHLTQLCWSVYLSFFFLFFPLDPKCLNGLSSTMPTVSDCVGLHSVNMLFINPHSTLSLSPCCVFRMVLITGKREWVGGRHVILPATPTADKISFVLLAEGSISYVCLSTSLSCCSVVFAAFLIWINGNKLIGWAFAVPWCWHDANDSSYVPPAFSITPLTGTDHTLKNLRHTCSNDLRELNFTTVTGRCLEIHFQFYLVTY